MYAYSHLEKSCKSERYCSSVLLAEVCTVQFTILIKLYVLKRNIYSYH